MYPSSDPASRAGRVTPQVFYGEAVKSGVKGWLNLHTPHGITENAYRSMQKLIYKCPPCRSWIDIDYRKGSATVLGDQPGGCLACTGIDLEGGRCQACGRGEGNDFLIGPDWRCPKCEVQRAPALRQNADGQTYINCGNCGFERRITKTKDGYTVMDTGGDLRASTNRIPTPGSSFACSRCAAEDYILSENGNQLYRVCKGCGTREFLARGGAVPPRPSPARPPQAWKCQLCGSMAPPMLSMGPPTCANCGVNEEGAKIAANAIKDRLSAARLLGEFPEPTPRPDSRKRFIRD